MQKLHASILHLDRYLMSLMPMTGCHLLRRIGQMPNELFRIAYGRRYYLDRRILCPCHLMNPHGRDERRRVFRISG
jgi:hypothetical protein